jgi:tRNA pseudouridine38-40 synthase
MRTLRLTVAYDGTNYVGWQRQANGVSIQQVLEEAFVPLVGTAPTVAGAGRTDAGVHALAQVASVNIESALESAKVLRALNNRLPFDVRVVDAEDVPLGFHARINAKGKHYRYRVDTSPVMSPFERWFAWHVPQALDVAAMREAAAALIGRHDFSAFQAAGSAVATTTRTLERVDVVASGGPAGDVRIEVEGDGFLRHMVRTIAGTLVEVGTGEREMSSVAAILRSKTRHEAGRTAPACGLTLVAVRY